MEFSNNLSGLSLSLRRSVWMYGLKPCYNSIRFQSSFNLDMWSWTDWCLILVSSLQLFTLLCSKVNWKAAIEEFEEEVSRPPLLWIPSHLPDIELMCFSTQIVRADKHLFLGFCSSGFYKGSSFNYKPMKSMRISCSIIGQQRNQFQLPIGLLIILMWHPSDWAYRCPLRSVWPSNVACKSWVIGIPMLPYGWSALHLVLKLGWVHSLLRHIMCMYSMKSLNS